MEIESSSQTVFQQQVEDLLNKEKVTRQSNNTTELSKILPQIIQLAFDAKEYDAMLDLIQVLSKKRGQAKKGLTDMVKLAMTFIDKLESQELKLKLIQTLKEVTDKKIFLEVEHARCCLMMVKHNEDTANIEEAAKILQEVQVETYGSMDKREKLEFILYQMRIMVKKQDFVRLFIISKKINRKALEEKGLEDLLVIYYQYLCIYYIHEKKPLETAECYKQVFLAIKQKQNSENQRLAQLPDILEFNFNIEYNTVLNNYVLYAIIANQSPEKYTFLNEVKESQKSALEANPNLNSLLNQILGNELISTDVNSYGLDEAELFKSHIENYQFHQQQFFKQLLQHNIKIVYAYYERINLDRLAKLSNVTPDVVEKELCNMINDGLVIAKIDRVDRSINFRPKRNENQVLNNWVFDIDKVLDMVDRTCNLIKRDTEVYK